MKLVYIVVHYDGDTVVDSVWTSLRKAEKRCKEVSEQAPNDFFEVVTEVVKH